MRIHSQVYLYIKPMTHKGKGASTQDPPCPDHSVRYPDIARWTVKTKTLPMLMERVDIDTGNSGCLTGDTCQQNRSDSRGMCTSNAAAAFVGHAGADTPINTNLGGK